MVMVESPTNEDLAEQYGRLVSVTIPCTGVTVRDFLRQAKGNARFLWTDPVANKLFAGMGIAAELTAWGANRFQIIGEKASQLFDDAIINGEGAPRLFGGFAFQEDFLPDNTWTIYTPACFVLPHYQITQRGADTWLTINATLSDDENPEGVLPQLREALEVRYLSLVKMDSIASVTQMSPVEVNYPMTFKTWERIITDATTRIQAGELKKVVLSRVCEIRFAERVDVDTALDYLAENYADCYRFLFEVRPYHAFFGATPELMASVHDRHIHTMGLAGSIRRGATPEEDAGYARQLFNDPKERLEHALVVNAIKNKLTPLTHDLHMSNKPDILKLSNIQHLYTPIEGHLLDETQGIVRLVELLHPTPALGGEPRDAAMQFIHDAEPVPRGWYGAPVGTIDSRGNGAFSVAIRSAVSQDRRVWLYAGAGIVGSSIPQKEWDETGLKFKPMLNALGIELNSHPENIPGQRDAKRGDR